MVKIKLKLDIIKDAWNWWDACQRVSHGVNWKKRIDRNLRKRIVGKTEEEAMNFLLPYLKKYYKEHKSELNKILKTGQSFFSKDGQKACKRMEKITSRPLYRKSFTCFLTTFPRCPYSYKKGYVWLCANWPPKCYLGTFLHELLHFQFFAYYQNRPLVKKLTKEQSEYLKESLTVILNEEFDEFLCQKDEGYKKHRKVRRKLELFWRQNKNFAQLVDYGAKLLTKQRERLKD